MTKFQKTLQQLKEQSRYRVLSLRGGIDLTSNDYLGMRTHPVLRTAALEAIEGGIDFGAGGSRLLRGHTQHHESLEHAAAKHFGTHKALYFANGFIANYALFTTLPNRHDTIIYDALLHASARDGIAASNAKSIRVSHNDLDAFERALKKAKDTTRGRLWIAVEALYSMDGDFAPLKDLHALSLRYDATLIIDEAHSTGVYGVQGAGLSSTLAQENIIALHTCGKALGVAGGLLCASTDIIEYMINKARPFIYSTAPPPLDALLCEKSIEIVASPDGDARRESLQTLIAHARNSALPHARSHIIPIILGEDKKAVEAAQNLQAKGYDIRAIRPPTVPEGTARLRLSLSSTLSVENLNGFFKTLDGLS